MKAFYKISAFALLATALMVSCEKETAFEDEIVQHYPAKTFTLTFAQPDTKVAITNEGKTTWEVGDEIMIHGGTDGKSRQKVTLTAEDISADGKKATITVEDMAPYDRTDVGVVSQYYAQYPASLVPEGAMYYECRFTGTNAPLMAACDVDDTFVFYNLCGIITFEADGEFDNFVFAGNGGETVGYSSVYQVRVRLDSGKDAPSVNYYKPGNGSGEPVAMKEFAAEKVDGVNYIYLPTGANFSEGFNFKFYDGDELVKVAKTETAVNVAVGKILALGDITGKLETYTPPTSSDHQPAEWAASATDLSVGLQAPANTYVLTAPGAYKIPAVKGNTTEAVGNVFDVELVWETYNNTEEVVEKSVIAEVDFDNDNLYFKTPDALKAGNALIAAKDYEGKIIWSWHIWIPSTAITTVEANGMFGTAVMDRNLGALTAVGAAAAAESAGFLYQWGRKDPFMGVGAMAANTSTTMTTTGTFTKSKEQISVTTAIANPTMFAYNGETAVDPTWKGLNWCTAENGDAWGTAEAKGVYDPCPAGYRVPAYNNELAGWATADWTYDEANFFYKYSDAIFPFAGYLDDCSGSLSHGGDRSAFWSATAYDADRGRSVDVRFKSGAASHNVTSQYKARGNSVRCVKIDGWVEPTPEQPATPDEDAVTEVTFWQDTFAAIRGSESEVIVKDDGETSGTFSRNKLTFITGGGQFKFKAENPGERVQLGGTGTPGAKNCLQFKVAGNGILKVWARSSSTDVRAIKVAVGDTEIDEKPVLESKGAVAMNTFKITANVNDLINVYSKSSAINVYDMAWIPEGNEDPQPEINPFTSNVAWAYNNTNKSYDEYALHATYNGKTYRYVHNLKLGTGSAAGSAEFTLPAGATKVTFYAVGWKGQDASIKFTVNEKEYPFESITSDDVITGNGPYNLTVTDAMKYSFFLDAALAANTKVTVTSVSPGYRVYIFGVNSSEEEIPVPEPAYEQLWGWYSAGDGSTLWTSNVTAISVTHPDGYGMVRGLAMDDEYIYLPKSSAYAAIAAVKITDPNTQVKGSVTDVSVGSTFQTSFVRMMKNTDASVNGGKDILLLSNLTSTNEANLVIYAYTSGIEAAPVILAQFAWDSANNTTDWRRYGDRFFVTGTWQDGKIWLPSFNANKIVCLSVANGSRTDVTQIAAGADYSPDGIKDMTVWGSEYLISNASIANVVTPNGEKSNGWDACSLVVSSSKAVNTWGYNFFEFNGKEYVAYARMNGKKACIEIIEKGASLSATIENPEILMQIPLHSADSLDSELTTGGLADCCVRVIDGVPYIAALTRDGALTVSKLVLK